MTYRSDRLYSDAVAVTTSDTTEQNYSGLYIGVTGDVTVKMASGTTETFKNAQEGTILPIVTTKVMATGTTATNILGMVP